MSISLYQPKILTLVVTHKCTASCSSCCFGCSPHRLEIMSDQEIKTYIDLSLKEFPSIDVIVFTGGEIFILGLNRIVNILRYIKSKHNKIVRFVSNGFWADSISIAKNNIEILSDAGLDELSISTGDVHLKHVRLQNILNIIYVHENSSLLKNLSIAIEEHPNTKFGKTHLEKILSLLYQSSYKTYIYSSPWILLDNKKNIIRNIETISSGSKKGFGCRNLYKGLQISPTGQVLACCGFAAEYSPLLKLGSFLEHKDKINSYLQEQYYDFLKLWLFVDGPRLIFQDLTGLTAKDTLHDCEVCLHILSNANLLKKLALQSVEKVKSILFKYYMIVENESS